MSVEDDKFVIHGPEPLEPLSDRTLGEEILQSLLLAKTGQDAMVDVFTGKTLSYKSLLQQTCDLAEALRIYGYTNNTVSICSENNVEFYIPILAALYVGCTVAPINHNYTEMELKHNLDISKPAIIFCSQEVAKKVIPLKKELKYLAKIAIINSTEAPPGTELLKDFVENALEKPVLPQKFQPYIADSSKLGAFILCSSGTTGLPKGVLLSHRNIMVTVVYFRDPRFSLITQGETIGLLPFFHGYGLCVGLNGIINKRKILVLKKFDEDVFLKTIQDYKLSALVLAPPLVVFLAKSPKVLNYDLSCLEEVRCGAAPLSKNTEFGIKKRFKNVKQVRQGYGLTEATLAVTAVEINVNNKPGSCGRVVMFTSCKVRDPETGKSLGPHQVGEICVKGPLVMMGYYNNEKATRESFTSDGWLRTGDMGYYDEDKYFYIVDRLKELIKYKGFQVAPAELEAILLHHPKVRDVGVVGLPDELSGELPVAFVVKAEGADVTEKELQNYVAGLVSSQKRLRGGVIFVKEIPKNPSGKILRRQLKQELKNYKTSVESKL